MKNTLERSLLDLLGGEYMDALIQARCALTGESAEALRAIAEEKISFWSPEEEARQENLMRRVGERICDPLEQSPVGAPSAAFAHAQHMAASPLTGWGAFRVGEDGRLYFAGKSEHYQLSLGHSFPGYRLIDQARRLGIPNATHNNTRGYITRLTERRLIALANGLSPEDPALESVLGAAEPGVLSRVMNLETGSLVCEAAMKMMLARFYALESGEASFAGRIPVFLVMGDLAGGLTGNYHGTSILAQTLRGLWPEMREKAEAAGLYKVVPVPINDAEAFSTLMAEYNQPPYRTAGFCHEIVLMNYGGIRLEEEYLRRCYALCREYDTPVLCDEIQSCAWVEGGFLFRQYGLKPDFVSIGKGFPGGEYPASRLLLSGAWDSLNQYGALVTNGQEELASLAYLVTMTYLEAQGAAISAMGRMYANALVDLVERHPAVLEGVEGDGLMSALRFRRVEDAAAFCKVLNQRECVDASAQTYKANCPPVVLTKLPLTTSPGMIPELMKRMERALEG